MDNNKSIVLRGLFGKERAPREEEGPKAESKTPNVLEMAESFQETVSRAVAGVLGGWLSLTIMHPIDICQKRLQVQDRR
jgi:hypothetical protein